MRPEETLELLKTDVNLERGKLTVRSGKSKAARRVLDLTTDSKAILARRMVGISPWIFPSEIKSGDHRGRLNNAHDKLIADAAKDGVKLNFCHSCPTLSTNRNKRDRFRNIQSKRRQTVN